MQGRTSVSSTDWQQWLDLCGELGIPLPSSAIDLFTEFYNQLLAYNQKVNLTRITEPSDFLYRHLLDSLVISPFIPEGTTVADVGSGAGFPALPLALTRPDLHITAIESIGKKCAFIEQIQQHFKLNVTVLHARSEDLSHQPQYREQFDGVTARAVAALPTLLEVATPLLKPEGQFIAIKGPSYPEELQQAQRAIQVLNLELLDTILFSQEPLQRTVLLLFEKNSSTPSKYPRPAGMASKKPL